MSHTAMFAICDDDSKKGKDVPIVVIPKGDDYQRSLTPEINVYYFSQYNTIEVHHHGLGECSITVYDVNGDLVDQTDVYSMSCAIETLSLSAGSRTYTIVIDGETVYAYGYKISRSCLHANSLICLYYAYLYVIN